MIRLEVPSFCFNSYDIGLPHYRMWRSIVGDDGMTPSQLAGEIDKANQAALQTFKTSLQNIILNTHGFDGGLWIGGIWDWDHKDRKAMHKDDLGVFGILKPHNVGTIWIVAYDIAESAKGQSFCQTLANVVGTQVIASDTSQEVTTWQGIELASVWFYNYIDDFEGTVYSFTPAGGMRKGIDPEKDVWTVQESRW
jgi:hypothetical protein